MNEQGNGLIGPDGVNLNISIPPQNIAMIAGAIFVAIILAGLVLITIYNRVK
jgi:hypothetical protein